MKYVWLVIDEVNQKVLAVYSEDDMAKKLAPVIAKKFNTETRVERRTINLELNLVGIKS